MTATIYFEIQFREERQAEIKRELDQIELELIGLLGLKEAVELHPDLVTLTEFESGANDDKVIADAMQEAEDDLVKPREVFLNVYTPLEDGSELHHTEEAAKISARDHCPEVAVKFREVMPEPEGDYYWYNVYRDSNKAGELRVGCPYASKIYAKESSDGGRRNLLGTVKIRRNERC